MRGRKPKPPALKIIEGNRGKRPIPEVVEPRRTDKPPKCPSWLNDEARKEWRRIVPELHELGLLSVLDVAALAAYCQSYARYAEAEAFLTEHGATEQRVGKFDTMTVLRAEVYLSKIQLSFIRQLCSEFGLSPSSRARMILPKEKEEDPFDAFVEEGRRRAGG